MWGRNHGTLSIQRFQKRADKDIACLSILDFSQQDKLSKYFISWVAARPLIPLWLQIIVKGEQECTKLDT
jgi:hypothetical protein